MKFNFDLFSVSRRNNFYRKIKLIYIIQKKKEILNYFKKIT